MGNKDFLTGFFDYLHIVLRYILSGFVSVIVLIFIDPRCNQKFEGMWQQSGWPVIIFAAMVGIFVYSIHLALIDKFFYRVSIGNYLETRKELPQLIRNEIAEQNNNLIEPKANPDKNKRLILFALVSQTYLRKVSPNKIVRDLQQNMETRFALLTFLYCTFYLMLVIPGVLLVLRGYFPGHYFSLSRINISMIASFIVLFSAIMFNIRITRREMWVVENFPQYYQGYNNVSFTYKSSPGVAEVFLIGTFNNWEKNSKYKFSKEAEDNWALNIQLPTGKCCYQFLVDGINKDDPKNMDRCSRGALIFVEHA